MQRTLLLLATIVLLAAPLRGHAQAVISEVLWMGSDQSTADEWFELSRLPCSGDCTPVDIGGWTVTSLNSSDNQVVIVRFATGTLLSVGHPLVVARQAAEASCLEREPDMVGSTVSLPNTKLLLKLFDAAGMQIDEVDDGVGVPFAGANPSGGAKASMERIDLAAPGNVKENWRTAAESIGFDAGAAMFGTPGVAPSADSPEPESSSSSSSSSSSEEPEPPVSGSGTTTGSGTVMPPVTDPPRVIVNAVLANPTGKDELGEWIELKNLSDTPAVLSGWKLMGGGTAVKTFALDGVAIAPSSVVRLPYAQTQLLLTNTKFTVALHDPYGTEVSSVSWESASEDRAYRPNLYSERVIHGTVLRVIDGDTFEVLFDHEITPDLRTSAIVRLIGVDAPESVHPTKRPEPYGPEASIFLRGLLEKKKVELQFDTENWDAYDRMLAYAVVDEQVLAQERLLSTGLARVYPNYPFARRGLFDQYEAQAKGQHVGMWGVASAVTEYKQSVVPEAAVAAAGPLQVATAESGAVTKTVAPTFSSGWLSLRISEVYAHPPKAYSGAALLTREWIELANDGDAPLALARWKIRVGEGSKARNSAIKKIGSVAPGARIVLTTEEETFSLRDDGKRLALVAPDGTEISFTVYPKLKAGQSWVAEDECLSDIPTPGEEDVCVAGNVPSAAASVAKKTKKPSSPKEPKPAFVLAQHTLESLAGANGETLEFGRHEEGGFWQAFTFFLAAVSLCQGALMGLVAWKTGLLSGARKLSFGDGG